MRTTNRSTGLCIGLLLIWAAALAWAVPDFGITWDEQVQSTYGELVLDYFASGGQETRALRYLDLFRYGPLFEAATAAVYRGLQLPKFEVRHLMIAAAAWLCLVALWRFGRRLGPPAVAAFAVLALPLLPRFTGHAANNSKDVPFACGFAWGMWGIARLLADPAWSWSRVAACGGAIGLALSMRMGALMLPCFLLAALGYAAVFDPDERRAWRGEFRSRVLKLAALLALAWAILVVPWPWTHAAPLLRPWQAFSEMADFSAAYTVFFDGELVQSTELPRAYVPFYLAITIPLPALLLAGAGLASLLSRQRARPGARESTTSFLLLLWALFPPLYSVVQRPNVYDGMRHFLFVLPAVALLAGTGCAALLERAGRRRALAGGLLATALLFPLVDLVRLHPYQSSYFNLLVGGTGSASKRYDTDYWASSYREAMRWIIEDAWRSGRALTEVIVACNDNNRPCAEYYIETRVARWRPHDLPAGRPEPRFELHCVWDGTEPISTTAHYYVGMRRLGKAFAFHGDWPVAHRIGRQGAWFSLIRRNPAASG